MLIIYFLLFFLITTPIEGKNNKSCYDLLRELANSETIYLHCVTVNSVPVQICSTCKDKYVTMQDSYNLLRNGTNCTATYFDQDRLNLVASVEAALTGLWTKAYCDECNQTNEEKFINKTAELKNCLNVKEPDDMKCKKCLNKYLLLNDFYMSLDVHKNGRVCFDIQDSMNRTRYEWSKKLKCCRREFRITLFSVALGIVLCLPISFYGGAFYITKRRERNHGILNNEDPMSRSEVNLITNNSISPAEVSQSTRLVEESDDEVSDEDNLALK